MRQDQYILPLWVNILRWRQVLAWFICDRCALLNVYLGIGEEGDTCGLAEDSLLACGIRVILVVGVLVETGRWDYLLQVYWDFLQFYYLLNILFYFILELINMFLQIFRNRIILHIFRGDNLPPASSFLHLLQHIELLKPFLLIQFLLLILLLTERPQVGLLGLTHAPRHPLVVVLRIIQLPHVIVLQTQWVIRLHLIFYVVFLPCVL